MVFAIVGIAMVIGDFGLSMAAIQSQTITQAQRSNLFWTNALVGIVLAGAIMLAAPLIANFYGQPELVAIAQVMSITFVLNALTAQFRAEVSVKLRFKWLALTDVIAAAIALVLAVGLAWAGYGYWALVSQQVALAAVSLGGMIAGARWVPGLPRRVEGMGALYRYGANTLGVQVFTYVTSNVDSVLIGRVWGAAPLGLYDRAYQLFRLPMLQIAAPMTKVAMPILSKIQDDDSRYEAYVRRAQVILGYVFGGTFLMLAALSDPVIDIALGPNWDTAKPLFAILAIGGVFQGIGFVYYWVFLSRALTGLQLRWTIIGRSAMVGMMAVGVIWGPLGVAIGSTLGQITMWALTTAFPMRKTGVAVRPLVRIAIRPILLLTPIAGVCIALSYTMMSSWNVWAELSALLALITLYVAACIVTIRPIRTDVDLLVDTARRLRRQ